ncbi:hypothetical protein CPC08DRAFT_717098 [Agrocybe pediades]|nr:hypothetical protein CPC08DRAFT_717098 [Agrocybe pediades]
MATASARPGKETTKLPCRGEAGKFKKGRQKNRTSMRLVLSPSFGPPRGNGI